MLEGTEIDAMRRTGRLGMVDGALRNVDVQAKLLRRPSLTERRSHAVYRAPDGCRPAKADDGKDRNGQRLSERSFDF